MEIWACSSKKIGDNFIPDVSTLSIVKLGTVPYLSKTYGGSARTRESGLTRGTLTSLHDVGPLLAVLALRLLGERVVVLLEEGFLVETTSWERCVKMV